MPLWEALAIILAGVWAGTINTVVGSGTLVTFPVLLFFGYPPVVANVSNSLGLVGGGVTGVWGYRREVRAMLPALRRLVPASLIGGIAGALLLLVLPPEAFERIVPLLILLGIVLVIVGPRLQRWAAAHHRDGVPPRSHVVALVAGVLLAGVYGGYFGAAQGVLLIGLLSTFSAEPLQRLNGVKNVLGTVVNFVAALVFIVVEPEAIDWTVAGLILSGALIGGLIGASVGRRLPPTVLRAVIVLIGVVAIAHLVLT
ncbi:MULTISPECIES: sulfite exporter TauE/SafE family protein [unclassified Janibacter]|uniref:sulfite exporter TauE/SafE family protein n=1 Tax=unclassified Janibacter TaxID=2649294 RepID=UPI003D01622E